MLCTASNIRDNHHSLEVVVARTRCFGVVVVAHTDCFVEDIVAVAAFAAAEAGRTVAVVAGIAVAASAGAEADCTAAFAAEVEAGCTDLGVLAEADCWMNRCCDFFHRCCVPPSVVVPGELVEYLREPV